MSEEKDPYKSEEPSWEEQTDYQEQPQQEFQYGAATAPPIETTPELTQEQARKKKRNRILIIVFAITIPVILAVVGVGFMIWGLVVGFTECANSCNNCCQDCFGCSESCNNCCDNCASCGSSCDNCCGSSSTIKMSLSDRASLGMTSFKLAVKDSLQVIQWYYYSIIDFLKGIFIK